MSIQMTATEAKSKLLSLLDAVADGEDVEITRHGRTVARLVAAGSPPPPPGWLAGMAATGTSDDDLLTTGVDWDLP